jgi:biotin carboxylase
VSPAERRPKRLLLLIPTSTYRTEDFMEAAARLDLDVVVASERASTLSDRFPDHLLALPFGDPPAVARAVRAFAERRPIDAVVPVDDVTTVVSAVVAEALGLRANPVAAAAATRDKLMMRERLAAAGVPGPAFTSFAVASSPDAAAAAVSYPCVLKPLVLSASRGVIRADDPVQFAAAFRRIAAILADPELRDLGSGTERILVEGFMPGVEVALEGLLSGGTLRPLALFDKPDPLDGPYFEETIYVTPSRLPAEAQAAVIRCAAQAAAALGLTEGPVHAELRVDPGRAEARMLEIAARSIGGLCSRTLSFGTGMSLEEIILRHALDLPIASLERERRAAGVMMIPIPRAGKLEAVTGLEAARAVDQIEAVTISAHTGEELVPLPEGHRYLGFIFAKAETAAAAEAALREAHGGLRFVIR